MQFIEIQIKILEVYGYMELCGYMEFNKTD